MARKIKSERDKEVDAALDELLKQHRPQDILNEGGLYDQFKKRLVERALEGEMTDHLGYEKHASEGRDGGNSRNGTTRKRVKTGDSEIEVEVPRDRDSSFEPQIIPKHRRRRPGFDDKVIALYARGMTAREIQSNLWEIYEVELLQLLISRATGGLTVPPASYHKITLYCGASR